MTESAGLNGLPSDVALWRLLSARGIEASLPRLREESALDDSLESMQVALSHHPLHARAIRIDHPRELAAIDLPSLLQLKTGHWVVLRDCRRRHAVVEGADGLQRMRVDALAPLLAGHGLETSADLPAGAGLWPRLRALLLGHRRVLLQFALASLLLQALAVATPELTGRVMGAALPNDAESLLRLLAVATVAVGVFSGAFGRLRQRLVLYLLTRVEFTLRRGLLEHTLRLPFAELQKRSLGGLMQAFYGIASARSQLAERILAAFVDGVLALGFLALMGVKLWQPTLALVAFALAMAAAAVPIARAQARLQGEEVDAQASQRGYLTELITGIRVVKAAGAERAVHGLWRARFGRELAFTLKKNRVGLWNDVGLQSLRQTASMALLIWGGYAVLQGEIGVGTLFAFVLLAEAFLGSLLNLLGTYLQIAMVTRQLAPADALLGVEALPPRRPAPAGASGVAPSVAIEMRDVWFRYAPDAPWVVQDYVLRVAPGEKHMLRGPSGSGKSTVLRLLAGLYAPERGSVTIGGREPSATNVRMLYLPQFVSLHAGTIMDNLRNLSGNAPMPRIFEAAAQTGFDKVVAGLLMGYHTPIPQGGLSLSGGQRQLLALTAALASDCGLLLLDEPMANLDTLLQARLTALLAASPATIVSVGHT